VLCVDEEREAGGRLQWARRDASTEAALRASASRLADAAQRAGAELEPGHVALGLFDEPDEGRIALLDGPAAMLRVRARAWVLATGRIEGAAAFPGNDLPGVIGAEAAARILAHGILPGERVVLAGDLDAREGELTDLARTLERHGATVSGPHPLSALVRADGRNQVSSVTLEREGSRIKVPCDLAIVAPRTSAAYELAVQAGARTELRDGVFEIVHVPGAHGTWIVGALAGCTSLEDAIVDGERAAEEIVAALGASAAPPEVSR
jgi:sarcosine oxidase subunit alpha